MSKVADFTPITSANANRYEALQDKIIKAFDRYQQVLIV